MTPRPLFSGWYSMLGARPRRVFSRQLTFKKVVAILQAHSLHLITYHNPTFI